MKALGIVLLLSMGAGCIRENLVDCGAYLCSANQVCVTSGCATAEQAIACQSKSDGDPCMTLEIANGTCFGGACHEAVCGDRLVEIGEVCDDGNTRPADGCSADCSSTEVCGNDIVDGVVAEQCDSGVAGLSADGCSSRCESEVAIWRDATPAPIGRVMVAAAYDSERDRMVVFGGNGATGCTNDTLEWDGDGWHARSPPVAPPGRYSHVLVYDSQRHRTVLFGGEGCDGTPLSDTWEWDGVTWTEVSTPVSPPARYRHGAAYDSARRTIVVEGGINGGAIEIGDTWEYDGTTWTSLGAGPAVEGHSLAYDAARDRIVLVGGAGSAPMEWDGSSWTPIASGPSIRFFAMMAYDSVRHVVVVFGGDYAGAGLADTWTWNGTTWANPSAPGPAARLGGAMAFDTARGSAIMFGGAESTGSSTQLDETWEWTGTQWTNLTHPRLPPARQAVALAFDARRARGVAFGGGTFNEDSNDTWEWDSSAWVLRTPATRPSARNSAALAYDSKRFVTVMFGGEALVPFSFPPRSQPLGDTMVWDGTNWRDAAPATSPAPRTTAIAYDVDRDRIVLFGGSTGRFMTPFGDTWEFDGSSWTEIHPATAPPARGSHSLTYDSHRHRTVLFGGVDQTLAPFSDTWEWDGATWTELHPTSSPPAGGPYPTGFDPARGVVVLLADATWEWNGTEWTKRHTVTAMPTANGATIGYDAVRHEMIMLGAQGTTSALSFESVDGMPPEQCAFATLDSDGDGLAGCADPDCWGRCTPTCAPGTTCSPTAPHCGDVVCDPTEDGLICPTDCPAP